MTDQWMNRLSEYLDDELDATERAQIEAHLSGCAECAHALDQLRVVVQRARALQDRPPAHELWSGIAARIEAGEAAPAPVVDLQQFSARKKLRLSFSVSQLIAAGILLMLVSGASVWLALSSVRRAGVSPIENGVAATQGAQTPANEDRNVVTALPEDSNPNTLAGTEQRVAAASDTPQVAPRRQAATGRQTVPGTRSGSGAPQVRNVSMSPDRPYDSAVADLQTVLREGRSQLDPKTVRALEDNLRVIDQAIAAARSALAGDTANVYLNEHLASNMQRKLELLRRATAIVSGQS